MRRAIYAGAAVFVIGTAAWGLTRHRNQIAVSSTQSRPHVVWQLGSALSYSLKWSVARDEATSAGETKSIPVEGEMDLSFDVGALEIDPDGGYRLLFTLGKVNHHQLTVNGRDALGTPPDLTGEQALVTMDRRGVVTSIAFRASASPQAREVVERVVRAVQVTAPIDPMDSWELVEHAPAGPALVRYSVSNDDSRTWKRQRLQYLHNDQQVAQAPRDGQKGEGPVGAATIKFDELGALLEIHERERTNAAGMATITRLDVSRQGIKPFDSRSVEPAPFTEPVTPLELGAYDDHAHDQRMSAGVAIDTIEGEIVAHQGGSKLSNGFLSRAGSYLRLHPDDDDRFEVQFESPETPDLTRQLLLDLMGAAGDGRAQAALRKALSSSAAHVDPSAYAVYVQRLGMLEHPDPATATFVEQAYEAARAKGDELAASANAVTLGGLVHRLQVTGHPDLADNAHAYLERDARKLFGHSDPGTKVLQVQLVRALGNAMVVSDVSLLAPLATSTDWALRDQTAYSLRNMPNHEAHELLFRLLTDPVATVAISAARALGSQPLEEADWARLEEVVATSNAAADGALARTVAKQREESGAHGAAVLQTILARVPARDVDLRSLVQAILSAQKIDPESDQSAALSEP